MGKSIEQQSKNNKTMKVNIENLRQSVMTPTKEDVKKWLKTIGKDRFWLSG